MSELTGYSAVPKHLGSSALDPCALEVALHGKASSPSVPAANLRSGDLEAENGDVCCRGRACCFCQTCVVLPSSLLHFCMSF